MDNDIKRKLDRIFKKTITPEGSVRIFENLEQQAQRELFENCTLADGELPIAGGIVKSDLWLLVTTRAVWWTDKGNVHSAQAIDLTKISIDTRLSRHLFEKLGAEGFRILTLHLRDGSTHNFDVGSSEAIYGIHNVIASLIRMTNR